MSDDFEDKLYGTFHRKCLDDKIVQSGDRVLIAVSGGADSTALLDLFSKWQRDGGLSDIRAAYYHHGLRPEADAELTHVQELCRNLGVEFVTGHGNVAEGAQRSKRAIHDVAREMRYNFLAEQAGIWRSESHTPTMPIIATGHHRDDQIETVLMRLMSGSGVEGLSGIRSSEFWVIGTVKVKIVRPLLYFRREDLLRYCEVRKLDYYVDETNLDTRYPRNRLRHELLPFLADLWGSAAFDGIVRTAELISLTNEVMTPIIETSLKDIIIHRLNDEITLDYKRFTSYLNIIRFACLRRAALQLAFHPRRITYERCKNADRFIRERRSGYTEIGSGINVLTRDDRIYIYRSLEPDWRFEVYPSNSQVDIPSWGRLRLELRQRDQCELPPPDNELYADVDKLGAGPYIIEPASAGDRIIPFGSRERRKVTDILRERGIPIHRRRYPVIRAKGQIAAVPPFRLADSFKLTSETRRVVAFRFEQSAFHKINNISGNK